MVVYESRLARMLLRNKRKTYITLLGISFTTSGYFISVWEATEMRIHRRQYAECFLMALIPTLVLCFLSWWFALLPWLSYYLLYGLEYMVRRHSAFDYEAETYGAEASYFMVRKKFAWLHWYLAKHLPEPSDY